VAGAFLPVVDAARRVIVTVGYVVVVVLTTMFAFHVASWTLARCLRLRVVVPARGVAGRRPPVPADSSVQTFIRHRHINVDFCDDDIDDDDDDDASDYDEADSSRFDSARRRGTATSGSGSAAAHARRYDSTSPAAPACSPSAVEFKYSETNV